jgi:murein DD-endopeptidase MepM/ murein hydrolase activator NlpD
MLAMASGLLVSTALTPSAGAELDGAAPSGDGAGFELAHARVSPGHAFFDGPSPVRLRYRFRAERPLDLVLKIVRRGSGKAVRRWSEAGLEPGTRQTLRWDGRRADGGVPADGTYGIRVGPAGHRGAVAGRFEFHDHRFPVAASHTYGDPFGEPRSGGRVHEGQDLPASCGTPLIAARGGEVQARGYSDALYGYWVLIDGAATEQDYFYAHLEAPTPLSRGEGVDTGERLGSVGKTGNARSEFCQLHFELWPRGYRNGQPHDPLPSLRRWDEFS